jgi:hypothetical protein
MPPIELCKPLMYFESFFLDSFLSSQYFSRHESMPSANKPVTVQEPDVDAFLRGLEVPWSIIDGLRHATNESPADLPAALAPLDKCILDIIGEILNCPLSQSVLGSTPGDIVILLRCSALYQAELMDVGQFDSSNNTVRVADTNFRIN